MATEAPFSKAEMLESLHNILLLYIRSTSWVLDWDAAPRLLGWPADNSEALRNVEICDFAEVQRLDKQRVDYSRFSVVGTFEELYDFGVLGFRRFVLGYMGSGTDYTFAMTFVSDFGRSELIPDMHMGEFPVGVSRCIHAARAAVAREILDGGDRFYFEPGGPGLPDDLLTISEVALLANMEERSARNAASGKQRTDSLKTVTRDGTRYVTREDALAWLEKRRGFIPTKVKGPLADLDLAQRGFESPKQIVDYIEQKCEAMGFLTEGWISSYKLEKSPVLDLANYDFSDERQNSEIAKFLNLDPSLFQLRIQETFAAEQLALVRKAIQQSRGRLS